MAHERNEGGPAFPQNDLSGYGMGPALTNNGGMSLRDWFAGQALPYVAEFHGQDLYKPNGPRDIASKSYAIADAMLAARASIQQATGRTR